MRKTLIAAAVLAAGAIVYYTTQGQSKTTLAELDYVPADTVVFSGQFEPVNMTDYLSSIGVGPQYYASPEIEQAFAEITEDAESPVEAKFAIALLRNYLDALKAGKDFSKLTGFNDKMRSLTYMAGLSPVIRFEVADEKAFFGLFDRAEQDSGFSHEALSVDGAAYRRYRFSADEVSIDLLVTVQRGWATLSVTSEKLTTASVAELLALTKPASSLGNSDLLQDYADKYQLSTDAIGYISFAELGKALTNADANRLARDVAAVFGDALQPLWSNWQNSACQQDVGSITANWPGVFFDSKLDYSQSSHTAISSKMLLASNNKSVLDALSSVRGYLPPHMLSNTPGAMFHFGLGFDPVQLSAAVGKVWSNFTEPTYNCEPLAQLQAEMKQANPMAMLAMAGMANGVQGISVTVNKVELDTATMMPSQLDALLTVSVANARGFIEGLSALAPAVAQIELPATGEEANLADILPQAAAVPVAAKLKLAEDHLLIYTGDTGTSQANAVAANALTKNGLLSVGMDYSAFFRIMATTMESSGQPVPESFQTLQDMNMKLAMTMDITSQGILTQSNMELSATKP